MNKYGISLIFLILLAATSCRKDDPVDFRKSLIGSYAGEKTTSYYYLNEEDTSLSLSLEESAPAGVLIGLAACENCIAVNFEPVNESDSLVSDTISLSEKGKFEGTFYLIGENYYREYEVEFDNDSLYISYQKAGEAESFRYWFRGERISD